MKLNIDKENLEKALNSDNRESDNNNKEDESDKTPRIEMSKEEEIGFHKGALSTLAAERNEIFKMIQNVEAIMQAHIKRLEELGVKLEVKKK